ncbi:MAG: asparagine synthase (glutamine-hydrolysing) [Comamonadaceae bacterium]|nr:MAG: asparagine synthase (glutamine-hydrolysing) [Comamonadaceae bacterium]
MSMIHGMICLDGRPTDSASLRPMLDAGQAACPDGAQAWLGNSAALGLGLLRTLPQVRTAPGPVRDPHSGLVIVADVRIDNRPELWGKLGLRTGASLSDAELILQAYLKWGEGCVEHLIGDFAFAIWDEVQRKLFCARDIFGINPFYYVSLPGSFIFSSNLTALLALEEIPRELDENSIADLLAGLSHGADVILYRGILALPPAHCLTVGKKGISLRKYWSPPTHNVIRFARDEDYVQAYRQLLDEAVACRLETDGPVSGMLSGGLDSGAIAVIAAKMLAAQGRNYTSYSFVLQAGHKTHERDERELIELVHAIQGIQGHFITTQDFPGRAADLYRDAGEYAYLGSSAHLAALFAQLHNANARVLLDGYGGDQCATIGTDIPLQEFLDGFHVMQLAEYVAASARFHGQPRLRRLLGMLRQHFRKTGVLDADELVLERSVLSPPFQQRIGIRERARKSERLQPIKGRCLRDIMIDRLHQVAGQHAQALFSGNQVERRYPFLDQRLVEFSLGVPARQHNHDMNRRLVRRAMAGAMPDQIRLRHDKGVTNTPGALSFLNENRDFYLQAIDAVRANDDSAVFIDIPKLHKRFAQALPQALTGVGTGDFMPGPTLRAFNMLLFLQGRRAHPPN